MDKKKRQAGDKKPKAGDGKSAKGIRYSERLCPRFQRAVDLVGRRWTALIVQQLLDEPLRFSELLGRIDVVSDRMLSERLKELEEGGLVSRHVATDPPVRVAYALTDRGRALAPVIDALAAWAEQWVVMPSKKKLRG